MQDRKELKQKARESIRATRPSPVLVTLAVLAIMLVTQVLSLSLSGDLEAYRATLESFAAGAPSLVQAAGTQSPFAWLLTLALDIMTMVVSVGYTLYTMRVWRRQNPSFGDVFDAFSMFFRVIWVSILRSLLISLWAFVYTLPALVLSLFMDPVLASAVSLPFLIPMFMAAYSYRLAVYIMLDNPGYSAVQCLALSRMSMKGRRRELFLLDLSFIGWALLCVVPGVILWVRPYMDVTCAGWYEAVIPAFWEEMKNRPAPQRSAFRSGDYHIPGESRSDDADDREDGGE